MKLFTGCSSKRLLWGIALGLLVLFALAGCSGGTDQVDADPAENDLEIKSEDEKLRTELEETSANLEAAESKIKELEDALETMQKTQTAHDEESAPVDIIPPERSPGELLLGEWYYQEFHEDGEVSWIQNIIFNAGGTGSIGQTYYIPKTMVEAVENSDDLMLYDIDRFNHISWSLNGNMLHVDIDNDIDESIDFTYSPEEQQFVVGDIVFGREIPSGMEQYVERSLYAKDFDAEKAQRRRRFLGTWYFDVLVWTFNDDETGTLDIPELGNQPAKKSEFTYSVSTSVDSLDTTYILIFDWDDPDFSDTWYCYPTFNADGSMNLNPLSGSEMKLTRTFDASNCPITAQIISNGLGVFSGSIFSDFFDGYE